MALSVGEACAVNTLIYFITNNRRRSNGEHVHSTEALEAANLLARGANRKLAAGYSGDGDLDKIWPPSERARHLHGELRGRVHLPSGVVKANDVPDWSDIVELLDELVARGWAQRRDDGTVWVS